MKNAFSALELLIIIVILCALYLIFGNAGSQVKSIVNERKIIQEKQRIIDKQIDDIQKMRDIQKQQLNDNME